MAAVVDPVAVVEAAMLPQKQPTLEMFKSSRAKKLRLTTVTKY